MKKSIYSVFVLALISGFFFNGCKNFLSGSELKNQLEKEIAYENTASCNVTVSSDYGKIANSGTYKMKASDPMTIEYSENDSGYQFVSWCCTPENSVTFSDKNSAKVTFTVKDSSKDISIFPELYKRLQITEVFPNSKQSVYPKDSSIIIKFSEKPSLSNDFSSIKIYYGYEDLTSYFKEPELRDNELVFTADRNNYLPVEEGTIKTLSVVIPSSLFYEVSGNKISLSNEYAFSYTINSSLDEKAPVINSLKVSRPNGTNPKVFPQGNLEQILQIVDKDDFFHHGQLCK